MAQVNAIKYDLQDIPNSSGATMKSWNNWRTPTNIVLITNLVRALCWVLDQHGNGYMHKTSYFYGGAHLNRRGRFMIGGPIVSHELFAFDHKYKIVRDKWILKNS